MISRVTTAGFEPAELPAKFEAGTPPIVAAIGLGAAIDYLNQIGIDAIHAHEHALCVRAHEVLSSRSTACRSWGPAPSTRPASSASRSTGVHAHDIAQLLDRHGIAVRAGHHCAMPLHKRLGINASTRASFYFYNTPDEVDLLGRAIEDTKRIFRRK